MNIDLSQPPVAAAIVAAVVGAAVGLATVLTSWMVAERKLRADQALALSDKAWADYELRRDVYMDIARQIDCLFEKGDPAEKIEFHRLARKVRLVGSDQVVMALNALTRSIKLPEAEPAPEQRYRSFFNAMRRDIRQLHAMPPRGTDLAEDAFPIEG